MMISSTGSSNLFSKLMYLILNYLVKISWQAGSKLLPKAYLNNQWTGFVRAKGRARQERGEERERGTGNKSDHTDVIG